MLTIKYFWSSSVYVIVGLLLLLCHNLARQKMVCCGAFFPPQFFLVSVWRSQFPPFTPTQTVGRYGALV